MKRFQIESTYSYMHVKSMVQVLTTLSLEEPQASLQLTVALRDLYTYKDFVWESTRFLGKNICMILL